MTFWRNTGSGLSTHHATYCLQEFGYMESDSSNPEFQTSAPQKMGPRQDTRYYMDTFRNNHHAQFKIIHYATSHFNQARTTARLPLDIFPFPTGMNVVYTFSQTLSSLNTNPTIVAYGWLYPETVDILRSTWKTISYKAGNSSDLDALESLLQSGQQVHALFCEIPSNVTLLCPDIHRIRELADRYGFIVVCDDTVAGFVNIDVFPYADVVVTSLTKGFSGASNVTGGSLVVNPNSTHHDIIHNALSKTYKYTTCFPGDITTLLTNSAREKVAGYVPEHAIRVSVGIKDVNGIVGRVREALGVVEGVELGMGMGMGGG